jgi:hypothetical protein
MLSGKTIVTTDTSLKVIKANAYKQGYNKAIDDFAEALLNWKPKDEEYRSLKDVCNDVAEQLKAGGE